MRGILGRRKTLGRAGQKDTGDRPQEVPRYPAHAVPPLATRGQEWPHQIRKINPKPFVSQFVSKLASWRREERLHRAVHIQRVKEG